MRVPTSASTPAAAQQWQQRVPAIPPLDHRRRPGGEVLGRIDRLATLGLHGIPQRAWRGDRGRECRSTSEPRTLKALAGEQEREIHALGRILARALTASRVRMIECRTHEDLRHRHRLDRAAAHRQLPLDRRRTRHRVRCSIRPRASGAPGISRPRRSPASLPRRSTARDGVIVCTPPIQPRGDRPAGRRRGAHLMIEKPHRPHARGRRGPAQGGRRAEAGPCSPPTTGATGRRCSWSSSS